MTDGSINTAVPRWAFLSAVGRLGAGPRRLRRRRLFRWASRPSVDNAIVKAVVRAFRWQRMLDDGVCGTIKELAERERVNAGYLSRVLRLTLLAPDLVDALLDGRQPAGLRLEDMLNEFPVAWVEQRVSLSREGELPGG